MSTTHRAAPPRALLLLVVLIAAALVPAASARASAPAPTPESARFEQWFLTRTIQHHTLGVKMAQLCVEKATDPLLRETCARTGRAQAEQIPVMQGWLESWYGRTQEASPPQNGPDLLEYLSRRARGFDFDTEMAGEFARHHRMQIGRSSKCLQRASHQELRDLCATQIQQQTKDVADFETVLERWDEIDQQQFPATGGQPTMNGHGDRHPGRKKG